MPKIHEVTITWTTRLTVVAPDEMTTTDLRSMVVTYAECQHPEACTMFDNYRKVSLGEAQAEPHPAVRVRDDRKGLTDEEVVWLGEGVFRAATKEPESPIDDSAFGSGLTHAEVDAEMDRAQEVLNDLDGEPSGNRRVIAHALATARRGRVLPPTDADKECE